MSEKTDGSVRKSREKKYCVAYGCNNIADETSRAAGISFHTFPVSDQERCKKWEYAMHRQNFQASKWSIVCSTHFEPECFDRTGQKVRICDTAVPTIFNVPAHLQKENKQRRPPKVRTAAATVTLPSMLTSASTSFGELDEQSGTTPEDNSTIQPTSGVPSIVNEHRYGVLESPMKLKRRLNTVNKALESYHKRLKLSQQRSRRLAKKVKSMETVIRDLKEKNLLSQQAAENLSASFSGGALELIKRCMNKGQNSKAVYPAELRAFALTLQFYSARAYDYVRQTFNNCLPHPKTLSEWYSCINGDPGFHDEIFAALKEKAEQCDGGRILCSFMMDEVAIRKQLDFDRVSDKFVGHVDMGVALSDQAALPLANEALVFMIVSLTERWKVPVAYFLVAGLHGTERANLVKLCLMKLYDIGIDVVSITFDGCSANCAMAAILGASLNVEALRPSFPHPSNPAAEVAVFLDACHMLKLMQLNAVSITIVNEVLTHLIGTQLFESLREHALDTELNNNHQVIIMKMVASEYIYLRLYHQCKVITRITQGASCRSVLSKTVLFKGQ